MEERAKQASNERVRPATPAHVFVFVASFCLMVVELVAGRLMAPYLGSSLYTWTSVIGVILTGITIGNYVGGVIAERGAKWQTVGVIYFIAACATVLSFYTYQPVYLAIMDLQPPLPVSALIFSLFGFLPLSLLLSMITPIVITLCLNDLKKAGTTVGGVYATSAAASIIGTFLTGYVLIATFGTHLIMLMVAAVLMLTGILAMTDRKKHLTGAPMVIFLVLLWLGLLAPKMCLRETEYYCIRIQNIGISGTAGKALMLDHLVHSFVTADERFLAYDYETIYAIVTQYVYGRSDNKPLDVAFLGGGGYVMPRYIKANYPTGNVTVAEIDPGVTDAAETMLGFSPADGVNSVNQDARMFLKQLPKDTKYDIVFGDAFNDYSIPYHLTTEEFVRMVHDHLSPHGVYALNVIDSYDRGQVLASFMSTLGAVFAHVEVAPLQPGFRHPGRNTYVLLASDDQIDKDEWQHSTGIAYESKMVPPMAMPATDASYLLSDAEKTDFLAHRKHVTLTDDYVPIDNMMAPVFLDSF